MGVTVAVVKERRAGETRTAAVPDTVKKLTAQGVKVRIETGAGEAASYPDQAYADAGAEIAPNVQAAVSGADILFKVRGPSPRRSRR